MAINLFRTAVFAVTSILFLFEPSALASTVCDEKIPSGFLLQKSESGVDVYLHETEKTVLTVQCFKNPDPLELVVESFIPAGTRFTSRGKNLVSFDLDRDGAVSRTYLASVRGKVLQLSFVTERRHHENLNHTVAVVDRIQNP